MDCRRLENLISPYLDGELSSFESETVRSHLSVCANCNREYEAMRRIADACNDLGKIQMEAPFGFKNSLMQKIRADQVEVAPAKPPRHLRPAWKRAAAGVAAAAMLAVGALSMNSPAIMQIADRIPGVIQPSSDIPAVTEPMPGNNVSPAEIQNHSGDSTVSPVVIAQDPTAGNAPNGVFLNKERYVITTLLQLEVADSSAALDKAMQMTAQVQGQSLNLGQQVGEKGSYTAVKITVARSQAAGLIAQLSSLGTVSGQEVDKDDISTKYADTLSRYQALLSQRLTTQEASQKVLLDQRISDLAAELQDWEQQADQETIVLWLE